MKNHGGNLKFYWKKLEVHVQSWKVYNLIEFFLKSKAYNKITCFEAIM